jgi:hypothetical protein
MLIRLLSTILIFTSLIKTEPSTDLIRKMREKIARINISFLENDYPDKSSVDELGKLLSVLKNEKILPTSIIADKDYKNKTERLIESYKAFKKYFKSKPEVDTLKKVFRGVNNDFNVLYGNYFLDELNKSSENKIILFSTSMSCECTLEMCYKQEAEIQKLQKENTGLFDYAVVDCFTDDDLQTKYEVEFIPTAFILDPKNKELRRLVREESIKDKIEIILLDH